MEAHRRRLHADGYLRSNGNNILSSMDGGMSLSSAPCSALGNPHRRGQLAAPRATPSTHMFQYGVIPPATAFCDGYILTLHGDCDPGQPVHADRLRLHPMPTRLCTKILPPGPHHPRPPMRFYLIGNFGNVPYADENVTVGSVAPSSAATSTKAAAWYSTAL